MGGTFGALAIDGNTVYLGIGPRLAKVDISDPIAPRLLWQSETLPGRVQPLASASLRRASWKRFLGRLPSWEAVSKSVV
jgi:hypothetical protein